jgi:hypothetical protein
MGCEVKNERTMQYPRIPKSPSLTQVFGSCKLEDSRLWHERVNEIFGGTIATSVELVISPSPLSTCSINPLEWQVLEELSNMLRCSRSNWKFWTLELIQKAIPKLVKACIWKNNILSENAYYRDVVKRYADEGFEILGGLPEYLTLFSNDKKPSTRRHLVNKYLEAPYMDGDSKAILTRALRCFITYRISKKPKTELTFKFCPDLSLSLWGKYFDKYLYEQLCLFIYLFRNPEEAHFFLERKQQLVNFVAGRLPENHADLAEVIVGETFDYLIKRRNTYCQTPDEVWMDTSLDTFFIGNILSSKRIQRFREKQKRLESSCSSSDPLEGEYPSDDANTSVKPKFHNTTPLSQTQAIDSEKGRLLRFYINKLDATCKSYFQWEFFGVSITDKSGLNARQLDAVEKPCIKKIRGVLLNNGYYDLFVK